MNKWIDSLKAISLPQNAVFIVVDTIKDFTETGILSSKQAYEASFEIEKLFERALKIYPEKHFIFISDAHTDDSEEFKVFPSHALKNTVGTNQTTSLEKFEKTFKTIYKNSTASHHSPELEEYLKEMNPKNIVVVGNVTDICIYAAVMHLVTRSHHNKLGQNIIVPANCVATWDSEDHPYETYHTIFLKQMQTIGANVVSSIK